MMEIYTAIQWLIIKYIVNLLKDGKSDPDTWFKLHRHDGDKVNDYALSLFVAYKYQIQKAVKDAYRDAELKANEHMLIEFGQTNIEHDTDKKVNDTLKLLNAYILYGLVNGRRKGTIVRDFDKLLKDTRNQANLSGKSLEEVLSTNIKSTYSSGLKSKYRDKKGNEWNLDRYALAVFNMIYQETYTNAQRQVTNQLAKVFKYPNPRPACMGLEASGIISIVPRSQLKDEYQGYANIYDPEHDYGSPGGHHGIHCRHVWHGVESTQDRSTSLYRPVDQAFQTFHTARINLVKGIDRLL